ncbi:MAG: FG-GAP-like repeat-containing protein [Ginsengibacter sp.]
MKTPSFKPYFFCLLFFAILGTECFSQTIDLTKAVGTTPGQANATATGGVSYTIPIDVLKGTNGMEPKVNLSYNSQSGEGIAGFGWSLSAYSSISRSGKRAYYDSKNTPVSYTNDNDAFLLDGQHLFPTSGVNGADQTLYGTENETFAKIESFGGTASSGPDRFEVTTRDGMILDYGLDATSKVLTDDGQSVMLWLLKKVTDKSKNYQQYQYSISQTDRDFALTEIDYTGNSNTGLVPYNKIKFAYSVLPNWQNRKIFEGGATITSPFLLSNISIYNANGTNIKTYQCSYTTVKNQSFLSSFTETGSQGASLNPLTFQYGSNTNAADVSVSPPYSGFNGHNAYTGELTGDGKDDIIAVRYFYDNNNFPHDTAYDVADGFSIYNGQPGLSVAYSCHIPWSSSTSTDIQGIRTIDLSHIQPYKPYSAPENGYKNFLAHDYDGDGKDDVLLGFSSIFSSSSSQPSNRIYNGININYSRYYNVYTSPTYQTVSYNQIPHEVYSNATCKYIANGGTYFIPGDFDGDGSQDYILILATNATSVLGYSAFFSSPKKGIVNQPIELFGVTGNRSNAYSVASTPYVVPIDFDGDGKQDILVETPTASYILSLVPPSDPAHYIYEAKVLYSFTNVLSGYRVFTGDFNGDGKTDLLVRSSATDPTAPWNILYSTGTSYKSYPFYFQNRPYLENDNGGSAHNIVIGDFNHDGKSDIWHSLDVSSSSSKHALYISNGVPLDNSNSTSVFTIYDYSANASVNKDQTFESVFGDFNFDGKPDIFSIKGTSGTIIYPQPNKEENLMVSETNGLGATTTFNYSLGYNRSALYDYDNPSAPLNQGANGNPYTVLKTPLYVVNSIVQPYGTGLYKYNYMGYEDAMYQPLRGFLGFKKVTSTDGNTGINTITYSEMDNNFLTPYPFKITSDNYGSLLNETDITNNFVGINPSAPFDKRYINEASKVSTFNFEKGAASSTDNIYDNYGNVSGYTTISGPFSGTTITDLESVRSSTAFISSFTPVPSLPQSTTVTKTRTGETSVNKTTTYSYNSTGLLGSVTDFSGTGIATTANYNYDNFGNIINNSISVPLTPVVNSTYDITGKNLMSKSVSGSGITKTTTFDYNALNDNISSSTSSDGLTTTFDYDGFGNLIKTTLPDGNSVVSSLEWQSTNGRYSKTSSRYSDGGMYEKTYYDIIGREVQKETKGFNDQIITSTTQYNSQGLVYKQTQPQYSSDPTVEVTNAYDYLQRLSSVSNGSATTNYSYNLATGGLFTTTTTNGASQSSSKTIDASGKVVKTQDNGGELDFTYDSWGNQKEVNFGGVSLIVNTYDSYGRKTSLTDKNTGTISYEYDVLGQLTKQTDANNKNHTFSYDAFGRILSKTNTDEGTTYYTYYSQNGKVNDNVTSITGFAGDIKTYQYDNLQRLISESTNFDQQAFTESFAYDANGNLNKTTYPSQLSINDTYDKNGNLTITSMTYNGVTQPLFTATALNSRGVYTGYNYGNGKSSTVVYDMVKGIPTRYYTPGLQDLNLNFEANTGNLLSRNDAIKGLTENFTYDNLNRLTGSTVNNVQQFAMTYDLATNNSSGNSSLGNIKTKSDIGNYQYDAQKINAVRFITSNSGNPTQPPNVISTNTQAITYTPFLKAETITENGYQLTYNYGEDYQRIKSVLKQGNNTLETKYYLGNYEKLIKNGVPSEIHYVDAGNGLCAIIVVQGGVATPYFAYSDNLGSPLTFTNSAGAIVAEQNFDAWGRYRNSSTWNYTSIPARPDWLYRGFTGHEHLSQFALINMNGRIYDPVTCRMLSPDNYVPLPWNTQGYNRYGYANNNPLSYVDPDGNFIWFLPLIGTAIGAITGGIIAGSKGENVFKGAVAGGILGASIGMGVSNLAKPELINGSFLWRAASSGLTDGSINILSTMTTHGSLDDIFRNGLIGTFSGVTGTYIGDVVNEKLLDNFDFEFNVDRATFGRMAGNTLNGFLRRGGDALSKHMGFGNSLLHAFYGATDGFMSSLVAESINADNPDINNGYIANLESSALGTISGLGPLLIQLGGEYIPIGMALTSKGLNGWQRLGLAAASDVFRNIKLDEHFKAIGYPFFLGGDYSRIYHLLKLIRQN